MLFKSGFDSRRPLNDPFLREEPGLQNRGARVRLPHGSPPIVPAPDVARETSVAKDSLLELLNALRGCGAFTWDVGTLILPLWDGARFEVSLEGLIGAVSRHDGGQLRIRLDSADMSVVLMDENRAAFAKLLATS